MNQFCPECGQPLLPPGVEKRPNEYDHAQGCSRTVAIGQVWKDCDKRMMGRYLLVVGFIEEDAGRLVKAVRCRADGSNSIGSPVKISVRRMKPGSTGYQLVKESAS